MNNDRNFILDRLKSRNVSIDEFNFDNLKAPPLSMFLTPMDIQELNSIATSLRLSAKPEERYRLIDQVMKRRGLVKFLSGTNRVTYRHPEFPDILFKVASDAVGIKDNPAEFYNQHLLKPFVTKIFEVSPGGVVAITERVNPITSREEFISVADDVFELISEWLIGEYVLADIGSTFFMNFGIRRGFGVVLLDYPYLYKLDGNKLYCNKPDTHSPTGKCDGVIDYDAGYNFLHCTKCGATYKAKELEQKIKSNEIINMNEGDKRMKVVIKGGSKNIEKRQINAVDTDNPNFMESVMSTSIADKVAAAVTANASKGTKKVSINASNVEESDPRFKVKTTKRASSPVPVEPKVEEQPMVVKSEPVAVAPVIKEEPVPAKKKDNKKGKGKKTTTVELGDPVAPTVVEVPVAPIVTEEAEVTVNGVNSKAVVAESPIVISEDIKAESIAAEASKSKEDESPVRTIEICINKITSALNNIEIDTVKDDILERLFVAVTSMLGINSKAFSMFISAAKDIVESDHEDGVSPEAVADIDSILRSLGMYISSGEDVPAENVDPTVITEESLEENSHFEVDASIVGIKTFGAITVDLAELLPTQTESHKILVLVNEDNKYVTVDNLMIVVDEVDEVSVESSEFVDTEYINNLINISEMVMGEQNNEEDQVEETEDETPVETAEGEAAGEEDVNFEEAVEQFLESEGGVEDDEEVTKVEV